MSQKRETRQVDIGFMIGGLIFPAVGFLIMGNDIPYAPGDPRAEPWYGLAVFGISIVLGLVLFVVGLVRLLQTRRSEEK